MPKAVLAVHLALKFYPLYNINNTKHFSYCGYIMWVAKCLTGLHCYNNIIDVKINITVKLVNHHSTKAYIKLKCTVV